MSSLLLSRRNWSRAMLAAVSSVALSAIGCSQNQPEQSAGWRTESAQAAAASETPPSESAPRAAEQPLVSMPYPTGNRASSELLIQEFGPTQARAGVPYSYQIKVTNLTKQQITGIVLHQKLPNDFQLSSNSQASRQQGNPAQIEIGDLGPGESKTVQMSGTPQSAGTLDTCLTAQYNPPTLCARIPIVAPSIKAVAQGPSRADVCQDLDYHYTVTNTGTGTADNVILHETLPDGLQGPGGRNEVVENVGNLAQGQSKDVNVRLRAARPGRYTTQAVVTSSDAGRVQTEQVSTQVLAPRLAVTITGPKEDYMGHPISYQINVKNVGDAAAAQTRLRLGATPGSVRFVNAEGGTGAKLASEQPGTGQDLGTIEPGQTRDVAIRFDPRRAGTVTLDATAQAQCAQPVTTSVHTVLRNLTNSALIVTHHPDPVPVGQDVTYQIVAENKGTAPDHNVRVTATLPESEQYVSAHGASNATANGQTITFGPIATLQPNQSVTWTVQVKAIHPNHEAKFQAQLISEATPTPAVKIEPTKLFAPTGGNVTNTNVAPPNPTEGNNVH